MAIAVVKNLLPPLEDDEEDDEDDDGADDDEGTFWNVSSIGVDDASKVP